MSADEGEVAGNAASPWPSGAGGVHRNELTPVDFLARSAAVFPDRTAVVHGARRCSYELLRQRVCRLGSALRGLGLVKHDRVAILSPNTPAMLEAHFGVPAAGGVLVAINVRLGTGEISDILSHCGARFLIVDHQLEPQLGSVDLAGRHVTRVDDTGEPDDPYEAFLATGSPEPIDSWLTDEQEPITINYTSGTTGQPKGVVYTHRGAYLNALGEVIETGLGFDSRYLWTLPMFHCNGWCFPWAVTAVGGTHMCLRGVDPDLIWDLLAADGVTHFCGAPTVQIALANHPKARRVAREVTVMVAGAPPSPTLIAQMEALNLRAVHLYGLTEVYGPHTICERRQEWDDLPAAERAARLARQGQSYLTAAPTRVVDDEMRDVPRDGASAGEVVMRGNNVMTGYFADPEGTAAAFRGGWFHSGDVAVWHPDGDIELRDRKKDIVISGGENISTIEVEQAVVRHPAVLECAVIAIPDERWGERPKAFVTLKPGQVASEAELVAFCREHLAHFKCPARIEFGELPKTATGKVQKFVLREREWADHAKRIN